MGPPKVKLFYLLSETHEIPKVNKYERMKKFEKNWGPKMGGSPETGPPNFKLFNNSR